MTSYYSLVSTYEKCTDKAKVAVADSSLTNIAGKGDIKLLRLTLFSVLRGPNINCNLIYISKLTRYIHCAVKFSSSSCVF